jgi:hypothetical protein
MIWSLQVDDDSYFVFVFYNSLQFVFKYSYMLYHAAFRM